MAIGTPIDRGTASRGYSSSNIASGTFTPAADAILLCFVLTRSTGLIPTSITGHDGGTSWVQIGSTQSYGGHGASLWGCHTGASPSSGTVSIAIATTAQAQMGLTEVTGVDVSGTVANSFDDTDAATGYASSVTRTITPGTNTTLGFWGSGFSRNLTPEGTVINQLNHPSSTIEAALDYDATGDTSPSCTLSSSGPYFSYAVELKEAAAGGTTVPLTGQGSTSAQGTLTPTGAAITALTGQSSTSGQGSVVAAGGIATALTGQESTAGQGSLIVSVGGVAVVALSGQSSTAGQGTLAATGQALEALTGQESTSGQGSISVSAGLTEALTGQSSTAGQGSITVVLTTVVPLSGQASTAAQGAIGFQTANILTLTGQESTGGQGVITVSAGGWAVQPDTSTTWNEQTDSTTIWTIQ